MRAATPLLTLALVVVGNLAGQRVPFLRTCSAGLLALAGAAALLAVVVTNGRGLLATIVVACLAAGLAARAQTGMGTAPRPGSEVTGSVELVSDPAPAAFQTRAVVRVEGRYLLATAERPWSSHLAVLAAGDRIGLRGTVQRLSERERERWSNRHVVARVSVREVLNARRPAPGLLVLANTVRGVVLSGAQRIPAPERGLVAGLLVGDTRGIPVEVIGDFRASGLSHLLAVSGANVAVVIALAAPLIRRLRVRGRLLVTLGLIVLFAMVTRLEPSVLRASAMAALAAATTALGRPTSGLRVLALAVSILLLVDPLLLGVLGFQLSCAASAGILIWAPGIVRRLPGPLAVREAFAVTAAAQLGVLPVLVPAFGGVAAVALPANVVAAPLAAPLTAWGMASGAVSALLAASLPEVATAIQLPTFVLARALRLVAAIGAEVGWVLGPRDLAAGGCAALVLWSLRRRSRAVLGSASDGHDAPSWRP